MGQTKQVTAKQVSSHRPVSKTIYSRNLRNSSRQGRPVRLILIAAKNVRMFLEDVVITIAVV